MVLTKATLDKMDKEVITSLYVEIHDKSHETITQSTSQVNELAKTLSRMEHQP